MTANMAVSFLLAAVAILKTFEPQDDVSKTVTRAEEAYYAARFEDSAAILTPLNTLLDAGPGRILDRIRVKLQLALAYIGLNQVDRARSLFSEVFDLDPQFELDREKFAPKVLNLAEAARSARNKAAADVLYSQANEAYNRGDLDGASAKFRAVLTLDPHYDLATNYLNLIEEKRKVSALLEDIEAEHRKAVPTTVSRPADATPTVSRAPRNEIDEIDAECIQSPWEIAMLRLKNRIEPEVPAAMRPKEMRVLVTLKIDERGNTSVRGLQNGSADVNRAIYRALRDWTFWPAKVDSQPRCVESELTIVMRRGAAHGIVQQTASRNR